MFYLVIYDISNDKDRFRLAQTLQNYGLNRIQYSAFKGELNPHDREILAKETRKFVTSKRDSIYIIPLCEKCAKLCDVQSLEEVKLIDESKVKII